MSDIGDLGIPEELLAEAADMFTPTEGFQLTVPEASLARRNSGYARWPEVVTIQGATREVKVSQAGDTHMIYVIKVQVMPAGATKNGGRMFWSRLRVNYAAIAAGDKDNGQYKMSKGAVSKLRMLAMVAGIDMSKTNLTGEILTALFPLKDVEEHPSALVTRVAKVSFSDNEGNQFAGNNQQEIDAWVLVKVPEADDAAPVEATEEVVA